MHLSRIKTLLAAPESSVEYYLTASVSSIAANASGVVNTPTLNVVVSRYKKVGAEAAALTTEGTLRLYTVTGSTKTAFSAQPSASATKFTFEAGYGNGCANIQAELTDSNGNLMCAPLSIPIIWKGEDGVSYEIETSAGAIRVDKDGVVQTGIILVYPYKISGSVRTSVYSSPYYKVQYSVDYGQWFDCTGITIGGYDLGMGVDFRLAGTVTTCVRLRLCYGTNNNFSEVYQKDPIMIVKDGPTGERGKTGRFYYYDGAFDGTKEYTATDNLAPYVAFDWTDTQAINGETRNVVVTSYYMLVATTNKSGNTYIAPRTNAATGVWELMETDFRYMITEAIFSNFAKLGSAVFTGDWMISQHGTLNGSASTAYQNFDASDPTGLTAGHFCPNYAIDLLTGKAYLNDAVVKGRIYAESGEFSGHIKVLYKNVEDSDATYTESGGINYYRLNKDLNIRAWSDAYANNVVLLPNDSSYIGTEVNLYAPLILTRNGSYASVRVEGGYMIHGYPYLPNPTPLGLNFPTQINWEGGVLTLTCVGGGMQSGSNCTWVIKSFTFRTQSYS